MRDDQGLGVFGILEVRERKEQPEGRSNPGTQENTKITLVRDEVERKENQG